MFKLHIEQQSYGSKVILRNISQLYETGKIHGFLGENGAGKTTLFQCMANILPYRGERMIPENMRLGFLPAELFMYQKITGKEFLHFFVTAKELIFDRTEMLSLNAFFELPLDEYAETYSTGMLKKLYLMGLLMQKNEVLILDEPFNGLDFKSSAFVTALITEFKQQGKTVFVASHDMDHLFSYADTLSLLRDKQLSFYSQRTDFEKIKSDIQKDAIQKVAVLHEKIRL